MSALKSRFSVIGVALFLLQLGCGSGKKSIADCACDKLDNSKPDLVCGKNGQTYQTECHALCAGTTVAYKGECPDLNRSCQIDANCTEYSPSCCQPTCVSEIPVGQPPQSPNVCECFAQPLHCGCDNNKCTAGTLKAGQTCDPQRDRCAQGSTCCTFCPEGNADCNSQCVTGVVSASACPNSPPSE